MLIGVIADDFAVSSVAARQARDFPRVALKTAIPCERSIDAGLFFADQPESGGR